MGLNSIPKIHDGVVILASNEWTHVLSLKCERIYKLLFIGSYDIALIGNCNATTSDFIKLPLVREKQSKEYEKRWLEYATNEIIIQFLHSYKK